MKRTLALILALLMLSSFVSCSKSVSTTGENTTTGKVTETDDSKDSGKADTTDEKKEKDLPTEHRAKVGYLAPDFDITDTNGDTYKLSDLEGNVVLLDFFATYCPYCKESLPELGTLQEKYKDKKVKILVVDSYDSVSELKNYLKHEKLDLTGAYDKDSRAMSRYNISGIPTRVIIDENGVYYATSQNNDLSYKQIVYSIDKILKDMD